MTNTLVHIRPVSGDAILYNTVHYMEWAVQPDKRYLKLFTGLSNHPVLHLGEEESYDFYAEWIRRFGNTEQYEAAVAQRKAYLERKERKERKQLGA